MPLSLVTHAGDTPTSWEARDGMDRATLPLLFISMPLV